MKFQKAVKNLRTLPCQFAAFYFFPSCFSISTKKKAAGNVQYLKTKTFRYTHYKIVQTLTTDMHGVTKKMSIQQADRLCTETIWRDFWAGNLWYFFVYIGRDSKTWSRSLFTWRRSARPLKELSMHLLTRNRPPTYLHVRCCVSLSSAEASREKNWTRIWNVGIMGRGPEIPACSPFSSPSLQYIHCSPSPLSPSPPPPPPSSQRTCGGERCCILFQWVLALHSFNISVQLRCNLLPLVLSRHRKWSGLWYVAQESSPRSCKFVYARIVEEKIRKEVRKKWENFSFFPCLPHPLTVYFWCTFIDCAFVQFQHLQLNCWWRVCSVF